MKSWFGTYFLSHSAEPVEATVLAVDDHITIGYRGVDGKTITTRWEMQDLQVSYDFSEQASRITSGRAPGSKLLIAGKQADEFVRQRQEELRKPWHRKNTTKDSLRHLGLFVGIIAVLVAAYLLLVPWLSGKLASNVSIETEERFGSAVYHALDITAAQDEEATMLANDFFAEMDVQTQYTIKITVVNGETVNAFALPGGNIIIYTALLRRLEAYPELAALLSHEFTHVNNRHSTKSIFRQLGSRVFLALLFGKFGSVTSILVDQAERFKSLKYSRGLEKESDLEGLMLLKERKIDPEGFVSLFRRLKEAAPAASVPEFLASHPDTDKRIGYIREASKGAVAGQHDGLKAIFEKLKLKIK